jgi:DNA-binding IscR family transcriptional regulator
MNVVLTTVDHDSSLMHHGVKGMKRGVRLYQYEDGTYTPLGRIHYGIGKGREKGEPEKSDRQKEKELKANISDKIKQFSENRKAKAEARTKEKEAEQKQREDARKEIRNLSDQELNTRLARLQKEKQYSELLNERENREKGPVRAAVSKLLKEAAENLARKTLNEVVDQVIRRGKSKIQEKTAIKLGDYKDVDPYSLSPDKLKAVSDAFNTAANLMRNKYAVEHEGRNPNDNNNQNQNNQQKQKNQNDNPQPKQQNNDKPASDNKSKKQDKKQDKKEKQKNKQQDRVEAMARSGKTFEEIAKSLHISESMVYKYLEDLV